MIEIETERLTLLGIADKERLINLKIGLIGFVFQKQMSNAIPIY